jgi:hypothetical protein
MQRIIVKNREWSGYTLALCACLLVACVNGSGVPLPIEPAVEFAKPTGIIWFDVQPNPVPTGSVTQQWQTAEIYGIAYEITTVTENFYATDSTLQSTRNLNLDDLNAVFDGSLFIPARDTILGSRSITIPDLSGGWMDIIIIAQDDFDSFIRDSIRVPIQ